MEATLATEAGMTLGIVTTQVVQFSACGQIGLTGRVALLRVALESIHGAGKKQFLLKMEALIVVAQMLKLLHVQNYQLAPWIASGMTGLSGKVAR